MLKLVVLGDSIAKGYGSSDPSTHSFGAVLGQKLDAQVTNLGIVGLDSDQLIEKMTTEKFQDAVSQADVICISIGSNDLLKPFLSTLADAVGVEADDKEIYEQIQKAMISVSKKSKLTAASTLSKAMKELTNNKKLMQRCVDFQGNFNKIITEIKSENPNAVLYVDNIYNPYYGVAYDVEGISVLNVYQLCETYITQINKAFVSNSSDYTLMDMYSVFRQPGYTNVVAGSVSDMSKVNFDPHPNDDGYRMMADYIYTQMDSTAPVISEFTLEQADEVSGSRIDIDFSEPVRLVAGQKLVLTDETDSFSYSFSQEQWLEADENGVVRLTVSLDEFLPEKNNTHQMIQSNIDYRLCQTQDAIKDRGNNSLANEELGTVKLKSQEAELSGSHAVTVKQSETPERSIHATVLVAAGLVLLIILILFLHKRHKKKSTGA